MSDNPETPNVQRAVHLPGDADAVEEPPRPDEQPLWWPNMEESRGILADYVGQFDVPPGSGTELPDDPDSGDES